jgi:predicted TIM-barrel fold metal-dependent hydrolase
MMFTGSGSRPLLVVDSDSHVIEPPSMWEGHVSGRFRGRVPEVVDDGGNEWLVCDGQRLMSAGHISGLGRGDATLPLDGALPRSRWRRDIMEGAYEPAARLADMDADGVDIGIIYPTVALTLYSLSDRALAAHLLEGYNRWLAGFCAADPNRLLGVGALLADRPEDAGPAVRRCKEMGFRGVLVPLYDDRDPGFASPEWDPIWSEAEAGELPVAFHAFVRGPGGRASVTEGAMDALVDRTARVQRALLSLILGGVFSRFPRLRIVSAENEAGWAASMLERADVSFRRGRFREAREGASGRLPSETFRDHVYLTILSDRTAVHARSVIGVDNLLWSSDYPHNVSTWPNSAASIRAWTEEAAVPDHDVARMLGGNARDLYRLEPPGPL